MTLLPSPEPDRPVARLDGVEREIRLLFNHREELVAERTRIISRLRWDVHELDPGWTQPAKMERASAFVKVEEHVSDFAGIVANLAARLVDHLRRLTVEIDKLAAEFTSRTTVLAPSLLAIGGCGALTSAKILGETAPVGRFHSKDAFARHNASRTVTGVVVESCSTSSLAQSKPADQCRHS